MANHLDSQDPGQEIFKNVQSGGDIIVGNITQTHKTVNNFGDLPKPTGLPQNIPPSSTDEFVGRARELERLHQQLQRQNEVVIAAVEGMGGVGKTELGIQYSLLHLHLNNYPGGICWLRAREEDIGLQIVQFALTDLGLQPPDDLELQQRVRWCWKHWHQGNTLVVLDDVKNYGHIKPYLPPQPSQFKVIITTRLKLNLPSSLFLEVLASEDALELLAQLIGSEKINQELEKAKELIQRLGYLPLALQLVGRYVKKRKISLTELLRRLAEKAQVLGHPSLIVPENDPTWTLNIKRGVEAAFELSWEELDEPAQHLGCLLLFALAPIPWLLVESAAPEQDSKELEEARVKLENLHLLQGENHYQLHQLIREFLRTKQNSLAAADEQKSNYCTAMVEVAKKIPDAPTLQEVTKLTPVIPHLTSAATDYKRYLSDKDLIWPFVSLGSFYEAQGAYAQALLWYEQCLSVAIERLGEEHPRIASIYNNLANLYLSLGRYPEAERLYQKQLELIPPLLGEEHPYHFSMKLRFKQLLFSLLIKVFSFFGFGAFSHEHGTNVASIYTGLALVYKFQGRYPEAEPLYQRALELRQRLLGEDHRDVANSYNNLAALYLSLKRYTEAEPLYQKALSLNQRLLGEEHPDIATSYNNLAQLYQYQRRYIEAEPLYQKALSLSQRLLGEEHPSVATSYNNLAELYQSQGRYTEAEPLYQKALEIAELSLGVNHPNTITIRENLRILRDNQA